ncbi:AraC family transcriptional regulator [Piscinibacter defluvii]|uniref:AraC family transcriptional regulator n=1 Tax=Piscinibacter defluvii TaxID=1796922 RepID=UPI0013E388B7|nr:AraC family transcriptional regulator [Piscinibacter defluvii]
MPIAPLPGPHGLYNVSVMPRFLLDSARVGWQGAYFTDIDGAREGVVDHAHERYCIVRVMHHEGHRALGQRDWIEIPPGFALCQPGDEQRFEWRSGGRSQFLFIDGGRAAEVLGDDRPLRSSTPAPIPGATLPGLIFDGLWADLAQGSPAGALVGDSLIAALVAHLAGVRDTTPRASAARASRRAIDLIEARFAEPIPLEQLAAAAGLGPRQFTRAFRHATGRSPHQYLIQRRVEHAQLLIRQGLPLAEVAVQCGFADQSQLTRAFAQKVGTTPGQFRRTAGHG